MFQREWVPVWSHCVCVSLIIDLTCGEPATCALVSSHHLPPRHNGALIYHSRLWYQFSRVHPGLVSAPVAARRSAEQVGRLLGGGRVSRRGFCDSRPKKLRFTMMGCSTALLGICDFEKFSLWTHSQPPATASTANWAGDLTRLSLWIGVTMLQRKRNNAKISQSCPSTLLYL